MAFTKFSTPSGFPTLPSESCVDADIDCNGAFAVGGPIARLLNDGLRSSTWIPRLGERKAIRIYMSPVRRRMLERAPQCPWARGAEQWRRTQ